MIETLTINVPSQPLHYDDFDDLIKFIRQSGKKYKVIIDVTNLNVYEIDLYSTIQLIWDLHENTIGEDLLDSIVFIGASHRMKRIWNFVSPLLPHFVSEIIQME